MYWEKLRSYVLELVTFLLIIVGLSIFLSVNHTVSVEWSTVFVLFCILVILWIVQYVFSFVPFALLVITDLVFKNYSTTTANFKEQFIFKSSSFLDKNGKGANKKGSIEKIETLSYKVVVKTKDGIQIFTSSEYFELLPGVSYTFIYGRKSKALIDVQSIEM